MLQITPQMKILVAVEPADFRKGIDGLVWLCKDTLGQDPFAGTVFVFRNRRGTAIKVLVYDGQGFWLCHKRLSEGRFRWWPSAPDPDSRAKDSGRSSTVGSVLSRQSGSHGGGPGLASGRTTPLMCGTARKPIRAAAQKRSVVALQRSVPLKSSAKETALDSRCKSLSYSRSMDRTCGRESRSNHDSQSTRHYRSDGTTVRGTA